MKMDLYGLLGVAKDASFEVIRSSYRKLVKQFHPDARPNDAEANKRFQQLALAYRVLKDEDKRAHYDKTGDVDEGQPRDYLTQLALSILASVMGNILRASEIMIESTDLRIVILGHLDTQIGRLRDQIAQLERLRARAEVMKDRWKRADESENLLDPLVAAQVGEIDRNLENVNGQIRAHELAKLIVADHAFDFKSATSVTALGGQFYQMRQHVPA